MNPETRTVVVLLLLGALSCSTSPSPERPLPQTPPQWSVALGPEGAYFSNSPFSSSIKQLGDVLVVSPREAPRLIIEPTTGEVLHRLNHTTSRIEKGRLLSWGATRVAELNPRTLEEVWSVDVDTLMRGSDIASRRASSSKYITGGGLNPTKELLASTATDYINSSQVVAGERLVVAQYSGELNGDPDQKAAVLNAVDRKTGLLVWQEITTTPAPVSGWDMLVGDTEVIRIIARKPWPEGFKAEVRELDTGKLRCSATLNAREIIAAQGRQVLVSSWDVSYLMSLDDCSTQEFKGNGLELRDGDVLLDARRAGELWRVDGSSGAVRWKLSHNAVSKREGPASATPGASRSTAVLKRGLVAEYDWATGELLDTIYTGNITPWRVTTLLGALVVWWPDGVLEAIPSPTPARDVTIRGQVVAKPEGLPLDRVRVACAEDHLDALNTSWRPNPQLTLAHVNPDGSFQCTVRARYVVNAQVIANAVDAQALHETLKQSGMTKPCLRLEGGSATVIRSPHHQDRDVLLPFSATLDSYYCGDELCPPADCYWKPTPAYQAPPSP